MIITTHYLKCLILKLVLQFLFMLGLIVMIDNFNIQYTVTNRVVYWIILAMFWIWISSKFDTSTPDEKYYSNVYQDSLLIWQSKRK